MHVVIAEIDLRQTKWPITGGLGGVVNVADKSGLTK